MGLAFGLKLYLISPLAARHLSRALTGYLHYSVRVASLESRGGGLVVRGLSVANPEGFPSGYLVAVDRLLVAPRWGAFVRGGRAFRLIDLDGVRVSLGRNRQGEWNLAGLRRRFTGTEAAPEVRIGRLELRDGAVTVEGRGVSGISLGLRDIATRGSADSRLELTFADGAGSRYLVKGIARPGPRPAFDLTLFAAELSLAPLAGLVPQRELALENARGSLRATAGFHDGLLKAEGDFRFTGVSLRMDAVEIPLAGGVAFAGGYDTGRDEARLERMTIGVADIATARLTGVVSRLRTDRAFTAGIALDVPDLGRLSTVLATAAGRPMALAGRIGSTGLRVVGDGTGGVTSVEGALILREGALTLGGRPVVRGVNGAVGFSREREGFGARGRFTGAGEDGAALVGGLDVPMTLLLSRRLRPLEALVPRFDARMLGVTATGRFVFRPGGARPLDVSLRIPVTSLAALAPELERFGVRPTGGTASLSLDLWGKGSKAFDGEVAIRVDSFAGLVKGRAAAVRDGEVAARFSTGETPLGATGTVRLDGVSLDGRSGDVRSGFRLADRTLDLDALRCRLANATAGAERVTVRLPAPKGVTVPAVYPFSVELTGGAAGRGDAEATGLSAAFQGAYHADPRGGWPEGSGVASAARLVFRGKPVGAPSARFALKQSGGSVELGGKLLDGVLSGRVSFDPRTPLDGASFVLGLRDGRLGLLAPVLPATLAVTPADGRVTASLVGSYGATRGLACSVEGRADGVALAGRG
ncbi:MAG: hypothetical protein ED859_13340, partial [Desulfuromonadales bacterium]